MSMFLLLAAALTSVAQTPQPPLAATELRRIPAEEARQGATAGHGSVYAIDNHAIGRYDANTGKRVAHWEGDPARFPHINSCELYGRDLVCAASNYPHVPMSSEVLWFDATTLELRRTESLGHGHGSLTWVSRHGGAWYACYANYDGNGGEPGRDHRYTTLVRLDDKLRETGVWTFPDSVLERFSPRSASGGAWGDDGLLYVTGHDRPEMYVLRVPTRSGVLEHVTTIALPTDGQAIGWEQGENRVLWSIERKSTELVASRVPPVLTR
ncbi:hypothetical protein EDF56_101342 [Novosphingobium sp. PhB165]|uniref:hypothetical protein n=1 Tax=Novosphingobium sp. PhB165 TaxID=2485105 RepID=UPI001045F516|nr:hypothetical protein [Novosphingobium sp. PhB165]TCM21673.1 hypothetical protein EDF56_101342 [Novosphingobium sp. PhB165]